MFCCNIFYRLQILLFCFVFDFTIWLYILSLILIDLCILEVTHLSVHLPIRLSICCTPYLKNCISSGHNFWYTYVKWWYFQAFFSFFQNFDFLGCWGVKGQKIVQYDKELCLSHSVSQEPYIIYCDFWYMCVKWWYTQQIVSFFKILILGFFRGVEGQKIT